MNIIQSKGEFHKILVMKFLLLKKINIFVTKLTKPNLFFITNQHFYEF